MLSTTEIRYQIGIQFVRLVAAHLALRVAFDTGWIDPADTVSRLVQKHRDALTIAARRFQADLYLTPSFLQKASQLGIAIAIIAELGMFARLSIHDPNVEAGLTDIDPHINRHRALLVWSSKQALPGLAHLVCKLWSVLGSASDTVRPFLLERLDQPGLYLSRKLSA